jgi:raffinose/stachyose/melibiose transport system permease protein
MQAARPSLSLPRFGRPGRVLGDRAAVILLFLPLALVLFTLFVVLPMGEAAYYSFFRWDGFGTPTDFVGLRNYVFLFKHRAFEAALTNNALIIAVSILAQLPLALMLAVILADRIPGAYVFRLIFFLPYVLAEIAAGMIWRFVYDGEYGLVAQLGRVFGFQPPFVLGDADLAIYAILVVVAWKYFGFHMMIYIAGLQGIDREFYEAAKIDGAGRWQTFRHVTLPMLAPTLRLSVFFAVLGSLQLFDMIMPLTRGGPSDSTQTLVTYLYSFGFMRMQIGFGGAVGVVLFLICVTFAITYKRTLMRHD